MTDSINKPNHYTFGKYECIDVIEELSKQNDLQDINTRMEWKIYKKLDGT